MPKRIMYRGVEWVYNDRQYYRVDGEHLRNIWSGYNFNILDDEVEIIGEDKKIRKIKVNYSPDIEEKIFYEDGDKPRHCVLGDAGTELLINKINEIIDKLNEMEKE